MMRRILLYFSALLVFAGCADEPATEEILFDFETEQDLDRVQWECHTLFSLADQHVTHGTRCLRLELHPSPYPGLTPIAKEKDWSAFRSLCFDVYNTENREITIAVRIDDQEKPPDYPDRYSKNFPLGRGSNHIEIPLNTLVTSGTGRQTNLTNIHRFMIFMVNPPEKNTLYVDYLRLVR